MILILTGPVHGGKTSFLERSLARWTGQGLACAGFLSIATADANGARSYDLLELRTGRRHPFLRCEGGPGAERSGPFYFVPETLDLARRIIRTAGPGGLFIVDEVGPLELRGGGVWPALRETIGRPGRNILLVVREEILEDVTAALAPIVPLIFDVRTPGVRDLLERSLLGPGEFDEDKG